MNLTKKTILALGLLAAAGAVNAQTATTSGASTPVGLLGQSYSQIHGSVSDVSHYSKHQYGIGIAGNVPVLPNLDLGAGYEYGRVGGLGHFNSLAGSATAYTTFNGVKPFIGAALGYQWTDARYADDDSALWGASIGVEFPAGAFTLTPRIVYTDDFRSGRESTEQVSYELEGNYWLNRTSAVFASVGTTDVRGSRIDTTDFTVGARFRF